MRSLVLAFAATLALAAMAQASTAKPPAYVTAAVADPSRPSEDTGKDAARKPAELIAFAGIKRGDKVGDLIMGGGYFTRIFAVTVGPKGKVYAYQPDEFISYQAEYGEHLKTVAGAYPNVVALHAPLEQVSFPEPLDVVWTSQNYHDLHLGFAKADTADKVNRAVFQALKPGGVYLVIDHHATAGSGMTAADTLHRIDAAAAKAEILKAGFVYEGESDLLRNPADPRTAKVFDASIRGHTDQFVYKFRKPRR
jgi:predicted methyltransferase